MNTNTGTMSKPKTEPNLERSSAPNLPERKWRFDAWLFVVFLLTVLMCLPFLRAVYWMTDEGVLLNGAERMIHGEIIYKDFFEFLPPGGFILTAWWFSLTGISVLSSRLLGLLVIVGIACFSYLATREATRNATLSAALTIGWVAASQGVMTQLSHHWLTTFCSMMAFCAALLSLRYSQNGRWLAFLAGASEGLAVMITPTRGALAWLAAAICLARQGRMEFLAYIIASTIVPAFLLAYLLAHHDLAFAVADFIRFTGTRYASIQIVPFGYGAGLQNDPIVSLFPLAGLLTILVCAGHGRNCLADRPLQVCIAFAVAGFISCFPRPDGGRIGFASPLALPLFAYCVASLARHHRQIVAAILVGILIIIPWLFSLVEYRSLAYAALHTPVTPTPRGNIALLGQPGAAQMLAMLTEMPAGQGYFFYPYIPFMSFLTGREQVSKFDIFTPDYTLPSQYQDACLAVMRGSDWVVVDTRWADPVLLKNLFPAMQNPRPPETQAFERALDNGFDMVTRVGAFELRHRKATASTAL